MGCVKKRYIIFISVMNMIKAILSVLPTIAIGKVIDDSLRNRNLEKTIEYITAILAIIIISILVELLACYLKSKMVEETRYNLDSAAINEGIYGCMKTEEINNILDTEINLYIDNYLVHVGDYISIIVPFIIALGYSVVMSAKTMIIILSGFLLSLLINQVVLKPVAEKMKSISNENEKINYRIANYLSALASLRLYGTTYAKKQLFSEIEFRNDLERTKAQIIVKIEGINSFFSTLLQIIPLVVIVVMVIGNQISYGEALSIMLLLEKIVSPIDQLAQVREERALAKNAIKKLKKLTNKRELTDGELKLHNYDIKVKNFSIRTNDNLQDRKLNLVFEQGKKYLIIGPNGTGKSSLLKAIVKAMDNYTGNILIGGVSTSKMSRRQVNKIVGYIPQSPEILQVSLVKNIALSTEIDIDLAKRKIEDFELEALNSEDENVADKLSGGERQRVSIARAWYHNKPIYLLDEVTCGLGVEMANKIEKEFLELPCTIIHVSHRTPNELRDMYDQIVELG